MSWQVVNLPNLTLVGTSASSPSVAIGSLDDAESITIYMNTTASATSTNGLGLQVSQFDPAIPLPTGVTQSTVWYSLSSNAFSTAAAGQVTSSGSAFTLTGISYRGLRLTGFSSGVAGEIVARASKSIFV